MSDLPAGWEWVTLEELSAVEDRSITDGPFGSNLKSSHYTIAGARVIRLQNIGDGYFIDEESYISLEHFESLRAHEAREGDLLVASLGDNPPRACLLPRLGTPALVKADCIRIRLHPEVDPKWVLFALLAPATKEHAAARIRGVGRPRLGLREIRQIPLPLPPLAEQHRIVAALDDLLSRIDKAAQYIDRVRANLSILAGAVRDAEICGLQEALPAGWRWGSIQDVIVRIEAGRSFACENRAARVDEWGVIKVSAMTWGEFREEENKAVPADRDIDTQHEIRPGDILVSRANTPAYVGAPVLVRSCRSRLLLSDKSLRLKLRAGIDCEWLINVLSAPSTRRRISARATGTKDSMRNISQRSLAQVRIPIPSERQQSELGMRMRARLEEIERVRRELDDQEEQIRMLRRSILSQAFSGRLVAQDPNDESAAALLTRIRNDRIVQGFSHQTHRGLISVASGANARQETLL